MKVLYKSKYVLKYSLVIVLTCVLFLFANLTKIKEVAVVYNSEVAVPISQLIDSSSNNITVHSNEVAYLDQSLDVNTITINGELHCDKARGNSNIEIKAKTIIVKGIFQCGTPSSRYTKNLTLSLKHNSSLDPQNTHLYRGLIVQMGGKLSLHGKRKNAGWKKLGVTAMPGDNFIILNDNRLEPVLEPVQKLEETNDKNFLSPDKQLEQEIENKYINSNFIGRVNWKPGDKIVIAPTGYNYLEAESFQITSRDASNPNKYYIDGSIQNMHWGETQQFMSRSMGPITLDERAEVANLSRNIKIQGDEYYGQIGEGNAASDQLGGHVMIHHSGEAYIDGVEFYKMGQAGVMARYPFHWHMIGNAFGQYIQNSSIHHSFQRCITIHQTNKVKVYNNVCYDFKGHGYFLEDGNEVDNSIIKNLAIKALPPSSNKVLLDSDNIQTDETSGRFPSVSCFWISNPDNIISHNIAAGCHGTGFWNAFENEVKNNQGQVIATPITTDTKIFNHNIAHACEVGMTWDGAPIGGHTNNPNNPNDRRVQANRYKPQNTPVYRGLKAYKNFKTGIYFRAETTILKNNIVADNGWSYWNGYNQVIRDSVIIGKTDNYSPEMAEFFFTQDRSNRFTRTGVVLYDGPFEVHNTDFLNFSSSAEEYIKNNGQRIHSTAIPFTNTGGSSKYINFVSQLYFDPEPVYKIFLKDKDEWRERQYLGNSIVRDLDGSLSGTNQPQVVVARRSMGITNQSNCIDAGETLYNYKICPAHYTEGSFVYMRWGGYASPWGTPFIALRSDGKLNYPKDEWNKVSYMANNLFATANYAHYSYKLLPKFNYQQDQNYGSYAAFNANRETLNGAVPVVEFIGYGLNCALDQGAKEKSSLYALKQSSQTSYYSQGDKFYVKVVPDSLWGPIVPGPLQMATAFDTHKRFRVSCDSDSIDPYIKGKITHVKRTKSTTIIKGWACNFTHSSAINVKLYAYGPALAVEEDLSDYKRNTNNKLRPIKINTYSLLDNQYSSKSSQGKVAFECGRLTSAGRGFEFVLNNKDIEKYKNHKFYIKGISNSGGQDKFIKGSGLYPVLYSPIKPIEAVKTREISGY